MGLKQLSERPREASRAGALITQIGNASENFSSSISVRGKMPHKEAPGGSGFASNCSTFGAGRCMKPQNIRIKQIDQNREPIH